MSIDQGRINHTAEVGYAAEPALLGAPRLFFSQFFLRGPLESAEPQKAGAPKSAWPQTRGGRQKARVRQSAAGPESAGSNKARDPRKRRAPESAASETRPQKPVLNLVPRAFTVRYGHGSIKSALSHTHTGTARNYS